MIIRIHKKNSIEGILLYNYRKEEREVAEIIGHENLPTEDAPSPHTAINYMLSLSRQNPNCKNAVFTASLNPAPEELDRLSDSDLKSMAKEYMEKMGYGDQPYIIFKHSDIERTHIHVVSVKVRMDGSLVSDKFEQRRTSAIRREMEIKYSLVKAEDKRRTRREKTTLKEKRKEIILSTQEDSLNNKSEKRIYMKRALNVALQYNFKNIEELNGILGRYRIKAELVNEKTDKEGILFYNINEAGEKISAPLKGSAVGNQFSAQAIGEAIKKNRTTPIGEERKNPIRRAIDRWAKRCRTVEELTELLKGEGIDTNVKRRDNGDVLGITFTDNIGNTITTGSSLGKAYSFLSLQKKMDEGIGDSDRKEFVEKDDYMKMLRKMSTLYSKMRKDVKNYYYESQLIEALPGMREDFLKEFDEDPYYSIYTVSALMRAVDDFIGMKTSSKSEVMKKEEDYFYTITRKYISYLPKVPAENRIKYLNSLNLGYGDGIIYSLHKGSISKPLSDYGIGEIHIPEKREGERTYPLSKKDRELLQRIIDGENIGGMEFEEYRPYHPLLSILSEEDRADFARRQMECGTKKELGGTMTARDSILSLLEKGFMIVPVKTNTGNSTYAVIDTMIKETKQTVVVDNDIKERLDRINYKETLLPQVKETVINKWGFTKPEYKAVVRIARASTIEDEERRDKEMEKAFRWLDNYDESLSLKMREKYRRGARISEVAAELQGAKLKMKNKTNTIKR